MKIKLISIFLVLLGVAGYFFAAPKGVDNSQVAICEAEVVKAAMPAEFKEKCRSDVGFAAMMVSRSKNEGAQEAAQRISQANQGDVGSNALQMFFIGLMVVGVLGLLMGVLAKKKV